MADVTGRERSDATVRRDRDRGQLFLITALALAVLFLGLALLFNTAIYTENLGSRNAGAAPAGAATYRTSVTGGTGDVIESVNRHNYTSESALYANLSAELGNWSRAAGAHAAYRGRATNASVPVVGVKYGARVAQDDGSRNFTSESETPDWTVVESAAGVRAFRMNVSRAGLESDPSDVTDGDAFRVIVTDNAGDMWNVSVYRVNTDETRVAVEDDADDITVYSAGNATHVPIDLTAGTINGTDRPALDFWENATGALTIRYENADKAAGRYQLIAPVALDSVADDAETGAVDVSPYATRAIYAATVDYAYESAGVSYRGTVRVAPGEAR